MDNAVKMDVIVRKDFPLATGESVSDATQRLREAGKAHVLSKLNATTKTMGVYPVDVFSSSAVFSVYKYDSDGVDRDKYYAMSFKRNKDTGGFEFGEMMEVERVTTFRAKTATKPTLKSKDAGAPDGWSEVSKSFWDGVL